MHVEDHPLEYGSFEGIIPKGEYGGGTVLLWDRGTWEPEGDPHKGYRAGNLKFTLHGEKLRGAGPWCGSGRAADPGRREELAPDQAPRRRGAAGEGAPHRRGAAGSVATGRTLEEIAAAGIGSGTRRAAAARKTGRCRRRGHAGRAARRPAEVIAPQLATLAAGRRRA